MIRFARRTETSGFQYTKTSRTAQWNSCNFNDLAASSAFAAGCSNHPVTPREQPAVAFLRCDPQTPVAAHQERVPPNSWDAGLNRFLGMSAQNYPVEFGVERLPLIATNSP